MIKVSQLYVYPIKSLGGVSLSSVQVTDRGFQHDRRWMLIDDQNQFLTQRQFAAMALLQVEIVEQGLKVYHKNDPANRLFIRVGENKTERVSTNIWGVPCEPLLVSDAADEWFSTVLNTKCRLVYMDDNTRVLIDEKYNIDHRLISFSDGYPVLMISESSLDDLNSKATEPVTMDRFRPNLVISGSTAFMENEMQSFGINGIVFYGVKPSARCVVTTINQSTAIQGKEPLKTLAGYRSRNNKIYFGENVIAMQPGTVSVGDEITILQTKEMMVQ